MSAELFGQHGVKFKHVFLVKASLMREIADDKPVTFIRYSSDGKYLATPSNEGPMKLWDPATGKLVRIFPGLSRADFSPDGETIACVSAASPADNDIGRVGLYGLLDGELTRSLVSEKRPEASWLLWVTFSPDCRCCGPANIYAKFGLLLSNLRLMVHQD